MSKEDTIDQIWDKLFNAFGDTQLLLQNKITGLDRFSQLERLKDGKDDEKISSTISGLLNALKDLERIAGEFDLEGELYYGGSLQRILQLMGSARERKFIKSVSREKNLKGKEKWSKLVDVLQAELRERQVYVLNDKIKRTALPEKSAGSKKEGG